MTDPPPSILGPHRLKLAVLQPQIAPNTGNIARLCVATGTELHLVRPMGFILSDRELKRSAMDYWPRLKLTVHDDDAAFFAAVGDDRLWLFTSKGGRMSWEADFADGDWLVFGSETRGIHPAIVAQYPGRALRIPQSEGERCLNLATAAGIGLYEALRQVVGPAQRPDNRVFTRFLLTPLRPAGITFSPREARSADGSTRCTAARSG